MPTYICLFGFVDSFDMPPTCYGLQLKISSAESVVCQKGKNGVDVVLLFEKMLTGTKGVYVCFSLSNACSCIGYTGAHPSESSDSTIVLFLAQRVNHSRPKVNHGFHFFF